MADHICAVNATECFKVSRFRNMKRPDSPVIAPSDLIGLVYEAMVGRDGTGELFARVQDYLGADCLQIVSVDLSGGTVLASRLARDVPRLQAFNRAYAQRWSACDPLVSALLSLPMGQVLRCPDPADGAEVAASPLCQELLLPHGLRWSMAGMFPTSAGATVLMARAAAENGPFDEAAAAALQDLLPHLRRAASLRDDVQRQLGAAANAAELLQALPIAYMLTDRFGRCVEANDAFRQESQRLGIRVVMGRLRFGRSEQQDLWERALQETHDTGVEQAIRSAPLTGLQWSVVLKPWRRVSDGAGDAGLDSRLILALLDVPQVASEQQEALLSHQARLTRAELEVLASLLTGLPAKTIAVQRGASVNTVRTQIMAILEKTGFRSQRELIASFGGTVASGFVESTFGHTTSSSRHTRAS